jgi:hypothetical protein
VSQVAPSAFDLSLAHRHFSAECFNRTWTLIEKPDRTKADDEAMVLCALASLWHWTQRTDCTNRNLSIGHWQVSRAYALAGEGDNAMRHGLRSLKLAEGLSPFLIGYAHEAIARAAILCKDQAVFTEYLRLAKSSVPAVASDQERSILERDLRELESASDAVA